MMAVLLLALVACNSGMTPKTAQQPLPAYGGGYTTPYASAYGTGYGTQSARAPQVPQAGPAVEFDRPLRPMEYRFAVGDELVVDVWKEPDLTTELRVLTDGTIAPQLVGSVNVRGRSIDETNQMLRDRYKEYIKDPVVSVRVTAIHSDRVFVLGEVRTPQAVSITGPTSMVAAISQAGGFIEEYADKQRVRVIRPGPDGQPLVHVVNLAAVLAARAPDPQMQRGDVIWVPAQGVTNWNRGLGQALAPFSVALGAAGSTAAIITSTR